MGRFNRACAAALLLAMALQAEGAARAGRAAPVKRQAPAVAAAYLAEQPAYGGMRFYVYKPSNIPTGWYATYDGYPVFRGGDGVWYYGTREGAGITQTGYVVGSVVPSLAGLKRWTAVAPSAPIYSNGAGTGVDADYLPGWARNGAFMAVEKWRGSVDRIGVINRPSVPVAWKGERPKVIYVWTGNRWSQIMKDGNAIDDPLSELRRNMYDLTVSANRSGSAQWGYEDMALLSQYAALWGYRWMGHIPLVDQFGRPGVPYQY